MDALTNPEMWLSFLTLTALELVLGIDNVIFVSILVDKLPVEQRDQTRRIGLALAMLMRVGLLLVLSRLVALVDPLVHVLGHPFSGRDLILALGGVFLVWKATKEVHQLTEGEEGSASRDVKATYGAVLLQIILIDAVFSLDSIITAVGMVDDVRVMIAAVIVSVALMLAFARRIGEFVSAHPSVKMLALSFLLVLGVILVAEGFGHHVPKGYIYFAMAFSVCVEMLNLRAKSRTPPVELRSPYDDDPQPGPTS